MLRITTASLLILFSSLSFGFGASGHQIIGQIAQAYLTPSAKTAIVEILEGESLSSASTWADIMRARKSDEPFWNYDYSANWHFINIAADKTDYASSNKSPKGDAYIALLSFIEILEGKQLTDSPIKQGLAHYQGDASQNQLALKFLIHLVGDLHQPLHIGYLEDKGGNTINVRWFNTKTNLHSVWDTQLVEYSNLSSRQMSRKLIEQIQSMNASEIAAIAESPSEQWLAEALELRVAAYDVETYKSNFREAYANRYAPIAERQLLKAGLRLAHLLNTIFSE